MKIGHLASGIWRSVHLDMAKALHRYGHEVIVYTDDARAPSARVFKRLDEEGVDVWVIHHERRNPWLFLPDRLLKPFLGWLLGRRFFTVLWAIDRYIRKSRCDVYMVEGDWLGMCMALLGYVRRFRWVHCVHDHHYLGVRLGHVGEPSNRYREAVKKWALRKANAVRANSFVTRDILVSAGIDAGRITVIPLHWTPRMQIDHDVERYRADARRAVLSLHGLPAQCDLIVASCRLTPFKGLELAIQSLGRIAKDRPGAILLVCGEDRRTPGVGSYRALLERFARDAGVADAVVFAGNIEPARIKMYYAAADVHVAPSYFDTFNYSAVEAALTGTPSALTDRVGCGPWLAECGAALVVADRDVENFAKAVLEVLNARRETGTIVGCVEHTLSPDALAPRVAQMLAAVAEAR